MFPILGRRATECRLLECKVPFYELLLSLPFNPNWTAVLSVTILVLSVTIFEGGSRKLLRARTYQLIMHHSPLGSGI